jgi:hypothetical protein
MVGVIDAVVGSLRIFCPQPGVQGIGYGRHRLWREQPPVILSGSDGVADDGRLFLHLLRQTFWPVRLSSFRAFDSTGGPAAP